MPSRITALLPAISGCDSWAEIHAKWASFTEKEKGDRFEDLTQAFLQLSPLYRSQLKSVWRLEEVPAAVRQKLKLPASKVYGVATFYNLFTLKPQGEHTCVVCTGTACYIKGAALLLRALDEEFGVTAGKTTPDRRLSVLQARCFGSCASAPAATLDGRMAANQTPELLTHAVHAMLERAEAPAEKSAGEKIA